MARTSHGNSKGEAKPTHVQYPNKSDLLYVELDLLQVNHSLFIKDLVEEIWGEYTQKNRYAYETTKGRILPRLKSKKFIVTHKLITRIE